MKQKLKSLIVAGIAAWLSACSTFYYGYSKAEWTAMSEQDQALAKAQYQDVLAEQQKIKQGGHRDDAFEKFKDRANRTDSNGSHSGPDPI